MKFTIYYNLDNDIRFITKDERKRNSRKYLCTWNTNKIISNEEDLNRIVLQHDIHNICFRDWHSSGANFIKTDCLFLDVDNGKTISDFIGENSSIEFVLYTSMSHKEDHNKFHVIFPINEELDDRTVYSDIYKTLQRHYDYSDRNKHAYSCFFGNPNPDNLIIYHNKGQSILPILQEEMEREVNEELDRREKKPKISDDELERILGNDVNVMLPRKGSAFYGLGKKCRNILAGKRKVYNYPSRSEAEAAVVMTCIKNGWSLAQTSLLFNAEAVEDTHFRKDGLPWLEQTFKSAFTVFTHRNQEVLTKIESFIESYKWVGNSKYSDITISKVILQIIRECGRANDLSLTLMRLAMLSGCSKATVKNSLQRLTSVWLKREKREYGGIYYSVDFEKMAFCQERVGERAPSLNNHSLNLFTYKGLGKTGKVIFDYLLAHKKATYQEIWKATGIRSRNTVKAKLWKMLYIGLLVAEEGKYSLASTSLTAADEKEFAKKLSVDGVIERRNEAYLEDKEAWKTYKRITYTPKADRVKEQALRTGT